MQSELTLSLCFFVFAEQCLSRQATSKGLQRGPKMVGDASWCTLCSACFLRLYVTNSRQKYGNKRQLPSNLRQEVKGVSGMDEGTYAKRVIFGLLSCL